MAQYGFGAGNLWGVQMSTATGLPVVTATPVKFGVLQDISIDMSFTNKELHGQNQFAVAVGRGPGKVQGKAKFAQINGALVNSLFFGQTMTTGQSLTANGEAATVPAVTPFTATASNSATWAEDLGVRYALTGLPLTKVATITAIGQYSVAAGVYTFYSADASAGVLLDYRYTATTGSQIVISNMLMGYAPTFSIEFAETYQGKTTSIRLNSCIGSKLNWATKLDNFTIPEFDFDAFADAAGNVATVSYSE